MQQIADWLEKLGLEQYTQRFAENEIDVTVRRHPTDQDLREIGVPLGQKILAAIREDMGSPMPVTSETALVNRADHAKTPQRAAKKNAKHVALNRARCCNRVSRARVS